jgi:hypothetical protein
MKVCRTCKEDKQDSEFNVRTKSGFLQADCKACSGILIHSRYAAAKELVFLALGNQCCRCGFKDKRALQIDHIHGGGMAERKVRNTGGIQYLRYAAQHPELFQILCANCNWIKRAENKEGNKWNFWELPVSLQMVSLKTASSFAAKNITGFIPEDRLLQLAAGNVGIPIMSENLQGRAETLK